MAKFRGLTEQQYKAAELLAQEKTQAEAAREVGATRQTINKWTKDPVFQEEVDNLRRVRRDARTKTIADAIEIEERTLRQQLEEFKNARIQAYKIKMSRGLKMLQKLGRRFDDIPEEAIAVNNLAALFSAADAMIEKSFVGWGDVLGVENIKVTKTAELEAVQKLVEAGLLPEEVLQEVSSALDEFQKKAIASLTPSKSAEVEELQKSTIQ